MHTLYGTEAKSGDYVLVQDVRYMQGSADILVAKVHGNKAYAASAVPCAKGQRWIRKETAIIKIDPEEVSPATAALIEMNINSEKSTFANGTEYSAQVWQTLNQARREEMESKESLYDR